MNIRTLPQTIWTRLMPVRRFTARTWIRYRALPLWAQFVIGIAVVVALFAIAIFLSNLGNKPEPATNPTVTVAPIAELSGNASTVGVIGTVRSQSEAAILAQSGGTVTSVNTRLGGNVPAGFVIASLENAAQRAAVLQAEGAYDAAIAARSGLSPTDISTSALNTYNSAYNSLDSIINTYVDTFYGNPGPLGPVFTISPAPYDYSYFPQKRQALDRAMQAWQARLPEASSKNAPELLNEADVVVRQANSLITDIAAAATKYNTDANETQLAALATARSSIASLQSSINAAKQANQSQSTSATAGADASVKSALGSLRAAQAALEKTLIRAPIGGQVNFLTLHVGDYVAPLTHVATVAQNGALEITAYISEDHRDLLAVGTKVRIEEKYDGIVTSISPALDPVTKQIEVHVAVSGANELVNGQSVRLSLTDTVAAPIATSTGPILLPLTALKLTPSARVVFSVGEDARLVAHPVEIGDVRGDRIEIRTALPGDLRIVTDARGLSDGQKVTVNSAY